MLSQFAFVSGRESFRYSCKTNNRNKDKRLFSGTLAFDGDRDFFLSLLWCPLIYKKVHSLCRLPSSKNLLTWDLLFIQLNKRCKWLWRPWKFCKGILKCKKTNAWIFAVFSLRLKQRAFCGIVVKPCVLIAVAVCFLGGRLVTQRRLINVIAVNPWTC